MLMFSDFQNYAGNRSYGRFFAENCLFLHIWTRITEMVGQFLPILTCSALYLHHYGWDCSEKLKTAHIGVKLKISRIGIFKKSKMADWRPF